MEIILYSLLGLSYLVIFSLLVTFVNLVKGEIYWLSLLIILFWPITLPILFLVSLFQVLLRRYMDGHLFG